MAETCGKAGCGKPATQQGYVGCLKCWSCEEHSVELEDIFGNKPPLATTDERHPMADYLGRAPSAEMLARWPAPKQLSPGSLLAALCWTFTDENASDPVIRELLGHIAWMEVQKAARVAEIAQLQDFINNRES